MFTMMNKRLGQYLRKIRESKGKRGFWSLRSVAKRAGISDSYLSQLETGQIKQPLPDILRRLADALRHPYIDIMQKAGYLPDETSKEFAVLKNLSEEMIEALQDPVAVAAMLATFQNDKTIKEAIKIAIENLPKIDDEKRKALLVLCTQY